jgi:renalase
MKKGLYKIAIIGAGISGMNCAYQLSKFADVTVFEKSRGYGGRMATKSIGEFQFDYGAQFFTAKTKIFQEFLDSFQGKGVIQPWKANFVEINNGQIQKNREWNENHKHYVGTPKMTSLCRYLGRNLNVELNTKINKLVKLNHKWEIISDESCFGTFDWLIITIPPQQAIEILPASFFNDKEQINSYKMQPCFSLMIGVKNSLQLDWNAAIVKNSILSWISIDNTKPLRNLKYSIVALSTNKWARENIEKEVEDIKNSLLLELEKIIEQNIYDPINIDIHRWRYANIEKQYGVKYIIDYGNRLGICGDWLISGTIESAFLSSTYLLHKIINYL